MVFVVREYGRRESITRFLAWLLLSRSYVGSYNRYLNDCESRTSMVYLLLHDG